MPITLKLLALLGDYPSASNARRCHGFPWERIAVLAEVEFCPLGASLFPSHQARYFCSLVVQGIASVLVKISVGVIGAELLSSYVSQPSIFKIVMRGYRACWYRLSSCGGGFHIFIRQRLFLFIISNLSNAQLTFHI